MVDAPTLTPRPALIDKPAYLAPCNGCGKCCQAELCPVAEMAFGRSEPAPCPALLFDAGRFWCGMVLTEKAAGMKPMIADALGIGIGCGMEDDE
jgi:hypothetical protein